MSEWEYKLARDPSKGRSSRLHSWYVLGCPKEYADDPGKVWTVCRAGVSEREARVYLTEMTTPEPLVNS